MEQPEIDKALAALVAHDTSRERADRIRVRALKALAAGSAAHRLSLTGRWRQLEPAAALAAGAAYMSFVLRVAAALYR